MNMIKNHRPSTMATAVAAAIALAGVALFVQLPRPDPVDPAAEPAAAVRSGSTHGPAARGPGIPPVPGATQNAPPDANPGAPTANLAKVANNLHLNFKSTTVVVTLPPGLGITNRVEVSTLFEEGAPNAQRITQTYDNGNGNRMVVNVAEGTGKRQVKVVTTLGETAADGTRVGTYAVRSTVNLEPLYNIALGPLAIYLVDDCDRYGSSEPVVYWAWPDFPAHGFIHRGEVSMYAGETKTIDKFAVTYSVAGQSAKLSYPTFGLFEDDLLGEEGGPPAGTYETVEDNPHVPLLPGRTHTVKVDVQLHFGSHCRAKLSYDLTITLRQYPNL
jgi:hypothetical protein